MKYSEKKEISYKPIDAALSAFNHAKTILASTPEITEEEAKKVATSCAKAAFEKANNTK